MYVNDFLYFRYIYIVTCWQPHYLHHCCHFSTLVAAVGTPVQYSRRDARDKRNTYSCCHGHTQYHYALTPVDLLPEMLTPNEKQPLLTT